MSIVSFGRTRPSPSAAQVPFGGGLLGVTTGTLGIAIMAASVGVYVPSERGAVTSFYASFTRSGSGPAESFAPSDSFGYEFGNDFRIESDRLNSYADASGVGGLLSTEGLLADRFILNSIYEFSDNSWRLKPYVGVGFDMADISDRLLGNGTDDRGTAYQLRGGVTLGLTQKLLGNLEYRWTNGSKPHLSFAGIPAKIEVDRHGFMVGMNYRY